MNILIDSNILIDYAEGEPYAKHFFRVAKQKYYEIYILEDVYAESKSISPCFHKIITLISELQRYGIYHRVKTTEEEAEQSRELQKKCIEFLGYGIDRADRKLIIIGKNRNLVVFSKDRDLNKIARLEGVKLY